MTAPRDHVAVLLAAGGSTRLGQAKQMLTRDGEALVRRAARLLLATAPRELVVVLGARHEEVGAALAGLPHRAVLNPDWRRGIASSLQAAAAALAGAGDSPVLVALCDQPALEATHLERLLALAGPRCAATLHDAPPAPRADASHDAVPAPRADASHDALSPQRAGVPALLDAATWRRVHELRGDRGFATLLDPRDCALLDAPGLRLDLDTPGDLAIARAQGLLDPG